MKNVDEIDDSYHRVKLHNNQPSNKAKENTTTGAELTWASDL